MSFLGAGDLSKNLHRRREERRSLNFVFWVRRFSDSSDAQWPGTNETKQFLTDTVLIPPSSRPPVKVFQSV